MQRILLLIPILFLILPISHAEAALSTNLSIGSQGQEVNELQTFLQKLGLLQTQATGYFGHATQAALTAYQVRSGIAGLGVLTAQTSSSLNAYDAFANSVTNPFIDVQTSIPVFGKGSAGTVVLSLQHTLHELGYLATVPTGYFGTQTSAALTAFQSANGIPTTGVYDDRTKSVLPVSPASTSASAKPSTPTPTSLTPSTPKGTIIPTTLPASTSPLTITPGKIPVSTNAFSFTTPYTSVVSGSFVTLSWSSNASGCTASGSWSGQKGASGSAQVQVLAGNLPNQTFSLTCMNSGVPIMKSVNVIVLPGLVIGSTGSTTPGTNIHIASTSTTTLTSVKLPLLSFKSSATSTNSGGSVTLTWSSENALSCTASMPGWNSTQSTSGAVTVPNITATQTYTITCLGIDKVHSVSKSLTVAVNLPPPVDSEFEGIGMNMGALKYYSNDSPFIDKMRSASSNCSNNSAFCGVSSGNTNLSNLDANGYPKGIPEGMTGVYTIIGLDSIDAPTSHMYDLTYSGTGSIRIFGATILSSTQGHIVFQFNGTSGSKNWTIVTISSEDPKDYVRDIHVVRQDLLADFAGGKTFDPTFLSNTKNWNELRFMDWNLTNGSQVVRWSERAMPSDLSWAAKGIPLEIMVQLSNTVHSDIWFNIPAHADDAYIKSAVTYIHTNLDPSLKLHLEYSNEVWNFSFEQSHYALTQGDLLWGTDANHDGRINPLDGAEHVGDGWLQFYGYRSAQMASIAKGIYGSDAAKRLRPVISTQTGVPFRAASEFNGVLKANVGAASDLFKEYAITTYFGSELEGYSAADRTKILSWARGGASGMDAAFNEITNGGSLQTDYSLKHLAYIYAAEMAVAQKNGLAMVAYEGNFGPGYIYYSPGADQSDIHDFIVRLHNDSRMGPLMTQMVRDFATAGGTELTVYADVGPHRNSGSYGVLEDTYAAHTAQFNALVAAQVKRAP